MILLCVYILNVNLWLKVMSPVRNAKRVIRTPVSETTFREKYLGTTSSKDQESSARLCIVHTLPIASKRTFGSVLDHRQRRSYIINKRNLFSHHVFPSPEFRIAHYRNVDLEIEQQREEWKRRTRGPRAKSRSGRTPSTKVRSSASNNEASKNPRL
jgi:hypothetical protein